MQKHMLVYNNYMQNYQIAGTDRHVIDTAVIRK
jgi:hypothetical protein